VEHTGRFLYVADKAHNAVVGFAIQSNGTIALMSGSPFTAGTQPGGLAIDPQGALLYTANSGSNDVTGFAIDPNSGALGVLTGSPFPTGGIGPSGIAVNSTTSVVYVTDQTTHDIAAMGILSDGALKPLTGSPFGVATAPTQIKLVVH
jgi:DNA-binding beta-propeller fold protein YncE